MRLTNIHSDLGTQLGDNEIRAGALSALAIGAMALAFLLTLSILRVFDVFPADLYKWTVIGLIFLAAFVMGGIIFAAWLSSRGHRSRVVEKWETWVDSIIKENSVPATIAPAPTPALPPENRVIPMSVNGRGGALALDLVDGWLDPRDIDAFAFSISHGGKWTETVMESTPLLYSRDEHGNPFCWGKDRPGSPYRKLMEKCVRMGIIGERVPRETGKLLITDEREIARRLKIPTPAN